MGETVMESEDKKNWALFLKGLSISSPLLTTVIAFAAFFAILSFTIQMFLKPLEQTQIEIKEDIKRLEKKPK